MGMKRKFYPLKDPRFDDPIYACCVCRLRVSDSRYIPWDKKLDDETYCRYFLLPTMQGRRGSLCNPCWNAISRHIIVGERCKTLMHLTVRVDFYLLSRTAQLKRNRLAKNFHPDFLPYDNYYLLPHMDHVRYRDFLLKMRIEPPKQKGTNVGKSQLVETAAAPEQPTEYTNKGDDLSDGAADASEEWVQLPMPATAFTGTRRLQKKPARKKHFRLLDETDFDSDEYDSDFLSTRKEKEKIDSECKKLWDIFSSTPDDATVILNNETTVMKRKRLISAEGNDDDTAFKKSKKMPKKKSGLQVPTRRSQRKRRPKNLDPWSSNTYKEYLELKESDPANVDNTSTKESVITYIGGVNDNSDSFSNSGSDYSCSNSEFDDWSATACQANEHLDVLIYQDSISSANLTLVKHPAGPSALLDREYTLPPKKRKQLIHAAKNDVLIIKDGNVPGRGLPSQKRKPVLPKYQDVSYTKAVSFVDNTYWQMVQTCCCKLYVAEDKHLIVDISTFNPNCSRHQFVPKMSNQSKLPSTEIIDDCESAISVSPTESDPPCIPVPSLKCANNSSGHREFRIGETLLSLCGYGRSALSRQSDTTSSECSSAEGLDNLQLPSSPASIIYDSDEGFVDSPLKCSISLGHCYSAAGQSMPTTGSPVSLADSEESDGRLGSTPSPFSCNTIRKLAFD